MTEENTTAADGDVLERLDALLNRDKTAAVAKEEIPLLTEIYQPAAADPAPAGVSLNLSPEQIEQMVQLLLPELTKVMQEVLARNIPPALETMLRDRLQILVQQTQPANRAADSAAS